MRRTTVWGKNLCPEFDLKIPRNFQKEALQAKDHLLQMERDVSANLWRRMAVAGDRATLQKRSHAIVLSHLLNRARARERELTEQLVEVLDKQRQELQNIRHVLLGRWASQ